MLVRIASSAFALLASTVASAHIQVGTYKGSDGTDGGCSLEVKEVFFQNGVRHPLNERVRVVVGGVEFVVGHPPVIDTAASVAHFNHDLFQGVLPTDVGAKALEIKMEHGVAADGPTEFRVVDHAWSEQTGTKTECLALMFQEQ